VSYIARAQLNCCSYSDHEARSNFHTDSSSLQTLICPSITLSWNRKLCQQNCLWYICPQHWRSQCIGNTRSSAVAREKNWGTQNWAPKARAAMRVWGHPAQKILKSRFGGANSSVLQELFVIYASCKLLPTLSQQMNADWRKYNNCKVNYKITKPTVSQASVSPVKDSESGISSLLNCLSCLSCKRRLHQHVILWKLPEQVLAPLFVPHKQILGDLHHVSTICQFLVDMQKHDVIEPGLSCGWAQVSLESL